MTFKASSEIFIPKGVYLGKNKVTTSMNKWIAKHKLEELFPRYRITTTNALQTVKIMDKEGITIEEAFNKIKDNIRMI